MRFIHTLVAVVGASGLLASAYLSTLPSDLRVAKTGESPDAAVTTLLPEVTQTGGERFQATALPGVVTETSGILGAVEVLRREVSSLRTEVSALRQAVHTEVAAASAKEEEVELHHPLQDPTARAEAEWSHHERMDAIEAGLRREEIDPEWSALATDLIQRAVESQEFAGTELRNVECRSTVCRVETAHQDPNKAQEIISWLPFKVAPAMGAMIIDLTEEPDKTTSTTLYIYREDRNPPNVAALR